MKVRLTAGAELDLLNRHELQAELAKFRQEWRDEAHIGPKIVLWYGAGVITAAGTLVIGGASVDPSAGGRYGPDPGMVWEVHRSNVRGLTGNDGLSLFINDPSYVRSVRDNMAGYSSFGSKELIVNGGDRLMFSGTGLTTPAGTTVTVSGSAWELPRTQLYRLR